MISRKISIFFLWDRLIINIYVTGDVVWMVRMACDLENNCVALERIFEYTKLQTEGSTFIYF